ncbi:O-Antigen ligase [Lachnospiraceae bacterium NE2001]|nr:O-Antigen ligase [Lachnospiraceae bacterium NE2001]
MSNKKTANKKQNSNSKSTNSKSGSSFDRFRQNRPVDIVNTLYLVFMTSIFSLYMHNKYFDITGSRGKIFSSVTIVYAVLLIMSVILEIFMIRYYQPELEIKDLFYKDSKVVAMPELWAVLFVVANVFAWFMSPNKQGSWDGSTGRFMGLAFIIVLVLAFILLARETLIAFPVLISLFVVSSFVYFIAILQHFGNDPFALREKVVEKQKQMFITTFGNINTYGSYIAVVLPVMVALFIFSKKLWVKVLSGISIVIAGMGIIPAKSDNVYLGVGVAFIVLFYIAVWYKRFTEYVFSVLLMGIGLLIMAFLNSALKGSQKHINGIAEIVENPKIMGLFVFAIIVVLIVVLVFRTVSYEQYKNIQGKPLLICITIIGVLASIVVIVLGVRSGNELFVFNDDWGTYRGYIWRRSFDVFKNGSSMQKLFGHGNETIALNMQQYYDEMVSITGKKYDNSHCEFLQYLVTTGIFGVITYYGMAAASFIYIGKRMKCDAIAIACLAGAIGYLTQALVNLNQPITTPYYFVILAAGIGYIRYRDQGYGRFADESAED